MNIFHLFSARNGSFRIYRRYGSGITIEERVFVRVFRIIQLQIVLLELCKACNFVRFAEFGGFHYKERGIYTHYKTNVPFLDNCAQ